MNPLRQIRPALLALVAAAMACGNAPAHAQDDSGANRKKPLYLLIEPANQTPGALTMPGQIVVSAPGVAVRISGATGLELFGSSLAIQVTPEFEEPTFDPEVESKCPEDPDAATVTDMETTEPEEPTLLTVEVSSAGHFDVEFTPKVTGTHKVEAADSSGEYRGEAEFEVERFEYEEECKDIPEEEIEEAAAALFEATCDAIEALQERVKELPNSPARKELEDKLRELEDSGKQALACGEAPIWANGIHHVNKLRKLHPAMRGATRPLVQQMDRWLTAAKQAKADAPRAIAAITHGNVVCDQLDIVINGMKFIDFYLGLIIEPSKFLADWAKENVPAKLVGLIPTVSQTPLLKDSIELGWKAVLSYQPKLEGGKVKIGAQGFDRFMAHAKVSNGLATVFASEFFRRYCQTFTGPVTGSMQAEFTTGSRVWWLYEIDIAGQLTLRYPQNAKGSVIALTGEFVGNATKLKSWDNAVPVLFPKLAMGTVFRTLRVEPIALNSIPVVYSKNFGANINPAVPDFNPIKSIIDQGGTIAQGVMTPAFFRVPVRAELRDKTLRLELQPAAVDFDDLRVKVIQIILPVLSLWPDVIDYALPYKGAHFLMLRAMNDGPVEFEVERSGKIMKITRIFKRKKPGGEASGTYSLTVTACNPEC
jgi:hypothetical protein